VPVPDTARTAALECASALGIKYREGFIKNRYIGRTFIMPAQGLRKKSVRQKLSPIASELAGRNILLVDDSIVRGTTSSQIIQMARDAGANKVYMASAAPPVKFPNVYGIDMPTKDELLASRAVNMEGIAAELGADHVIYQDLDDLRASIVEEAVAVGSALNQLDCSCFNGNYVTELGDDYLNTLATARQASRGDVSSPVATSQHLLDTLQITGSSGRLSPGGTTRLSPPKSPPLEADMSAAMPPPPKF
jgi:amidophosphoribosyltransferase